MATIEVAPAVRTQTARLDILGALHAGLQIMLRRHRERRLLVRLSRLQPHVVRDMGFDPDSISDALEGSWDEVKPGQFRSR